MKLLYPLVGKWPVSTQYGAILLDAAAAAAAVRPALFGPYMRARWAMVDAGGDANTSHTFSVIVYAE